MAMTSPFSTTSLSPPSHLFLHSPKPLITRHSFIIQASTEPGPTEPETGSNPPQPDDPFESKLAKIRVRNRSGLGKKSEVRKSKKGKTGSGSGSGSSTGSTVFLPAVPLKEPVSNGLKVEFGFGPYSERVNGRLAGLGLVALLLVELATGKSVVNYHTPSIVFIQMYFMTALCAMFLKFEKEKVSVWPQVSTVDKQ